MKGDYNALKELSSKELEQSITEGEIAEMTYDEAVASPHIKQTANVIRFQWDAEQVQVLVSRTRQHRDGRVTAELKVTSTAPGFPSHLHQAQINLVATRSKIELARHLSDLRNDIDWTALVEELARETLDRIRQGEPVIEISTEDDVEPPSYALAPIIPNEQPTIIYGPGGTGKSMLALACGLIIQLPWADNPLGLKLTDRKGVIYLDWETSYTEIAWRMKCLRQGMDAPFVSIHYRRCAMPLADDCGAIGRTILDQNIGFVIVDSVGAACGGDLNAAEPAIRMFTALRELKLTSLLIAHTSKNPATKETTVYGSAFFNFYARSVWEMKKVQEAGDKCIKVGLYHKKANMSGLHQPLGFKMSFDTESARIERMNVGDVSELAEHLPLRQRIKSALKERGKMDSATLAEYIGNKEGAVRVKLYDLLKAGDVVKIDKYWGLSYQ